MQKAIESAENTTFNGFTVSELLEFKKLHDELDALRKDNQELLRKLNDNNQRYALLKTYVETLDVTVDTRLLTQATSDIKELKEHEEEAKRAREHTERMIGSIETGTLMLVVGMILHWLKWFLFDPKRRKALIHEVQKRAADYNRQEEELARERVEHDEHHPGHGHHYSE